MSAIYLLIFASLLVALGFLAAYIWAVSTGQFDDTYTPSLRILMDDPAPPKPPVDMGSATLPIVPSGHPTPQDSEVQSPPIP